MQYNKKSVFGLLLDEKLYHESKKEGGVKTYLNLNSLIRVICASGVPFNEIKSRGLGQKGARNDGVKLLIDRQHTSEEKKALADFFRNTGLSFLRIADKIDNW